MSRRLFQLSAAASLDLREAWNYLADQASIDVADHVLDNLESAIQKIARSPKLGHRRPDLTQRDLRFYLMRPYLIVYRMDKKPIHVVRVVHAKRDVKSLLTEKETT